MTFWNELKKNMKLILGFSLIAVLLSQVILPATSTRAAEPKFNFLPADYKMLRGANVTAGESVWKDPISGVAGDVFDGLVYYHNGVVETTANNTKVKVSIPTEAVGGKAVLSASISADNADMVSDSLDVLVPSGTKLEFVPGSVVWYPNQNQTPGNSATLPLGQSGNEIISSTGLNIGVIQGCWDYAGFVKFSFRTVAPIVSKIDKSKIAKNLVSGTTGTDLAAKAGDKILYTLTTKNSGNTAESVTVSDNISDVMEYASSVEVAEGGSVHNGVVSWGAKSLASGESVDNHFTVTISSPLPNDPQSGFHFDFILFNAYGNDVYVRLPKPVPGQPNLTLVKTVRNFTAGETTFVKANQANAGDTLEYKLDFANTGEGDALNSTLADTLPANVSYLAGTTIISMDGGDEHTYIDGIINGVTLNLLAHSKGYIKFKVITSKSIAPSEVLTNTVFLKYGATNLSDTAKTTIKTVVTPATPELPKTGAENIVLIFLLTIAAGVTWTYISYKKRLAKMLA